MCAFAADTSTMRDVCENCTQPAEVRGRQEKLAAQVPMAGYCAYTVPIWPQGARSVVRPQHRMRPFSKRAQEWRLRGIEIERERLRLREKVKIKMKNMVRERCKRVQWMYSNRKFVVFSLPSNGSGDDGDDIHACSESDEFRLGDGAQPVVRPLVDRRDVP